MPDPYVIIIIFFFYGLAFFSMGVVIIIELGHCTNNRLRRALQPLAAFGIIHGAHEWVEMFQIINVSYIGGEVSTIWRGMNVGILAFSFLSLAASGAFLLTQDEQKQRYSLLIPLAMATVWAFGILVLRGKYTQNEMFIVADVWTRYTLAIPAAIIVAIGFVIQQRQFRTEGLISFGRDCLWVAVAFIWYGLIGQVFTKPSQLPPSTEINSLLFYDMFGFPVQLLRAIAAIVVAIFVIRFLRSIEYEIRVKMNLLQEAQIRESKQRELLRGEMLRRIVAAQESERQRIARELHDATGQSLTAIGMGLRGASSAIGKDNEKAERKIHYLEGLVDDSLNELQRLITDLRPSHLDDLGLPATIRWYANDIQRHVPLNVHVEVEDYAGELPYETKIAIFRIIQEALTNVIKHANAENAYIQLSCNDDVVHVMVKDDGAGFDPSKMFNPDRPAWGLIGMKERSSLLDGSFNIISTPGSGTVVDVHIPYKAQTGDINDD